MKSGPDSYAKRFPLKSWIFPMCVAGTYLILWMIIPDRTSQALRVVVHILIQVSVPLLLAFFMMFLLNLFVTPSHISRFMGQKSGALGILLSSAAGIISMGPVYAWYPFLASLKEKGASDFNLANFLSNRSVKPALIPLMIAYFGWRFSLVFAVFGVLSALAVAMSVSLVNRIVKKS
jgi:uncharacterized membrane protein YraQ (UPF0718 family)